MKGKDLNTLRTKVASIEARYHGALSVRHLKTRYQCLDEALGGGLRYGAVHEFLGAGADQELCARPTQFIARALAETIGTIVWIGPTDSHVCVAGLNAAGLSEKRVLFVKAESTQANSVMEDVLRSKGAISVVLDVTKPLTLKTSRRFQLAAEASGGIGFIVHRHTHALLPTACWTRWQIGSAPSVRHALGQRQRLSPSHMSSIVLLRHRGGKTLSWETRGSYVSSFSISLDALLA